MVVVGRWRLQVDESKLGGELVVRSTHSKENSVRTRVVVVSSSGGYHSSKKALEPRE